MKRSVQRITAGVALGILVLVAAILAPFAYVQRNDAIAAQKREAEARHGEQAQRQLAESAAAKEAGARNEAEIQRVGAEEQARLATQAQAEAGLSSRLATARRLTAQSLLVRTQNPNRIATYFLLGVESLSRTPTLDAIQALADDLPLLRQLKSQFTHQVTHLSVAFSLDGRRVPIAGLDWARVLESATGKEVERSRFPSVLSIE